jgi:hypothetical protein
VIPILALRKLDIFKNQMLRKIDFSLYIFDIPDISYNYGLELLL